MVKNDPKVIAKLLRCVAGGSYAKENATAHIFEAAADLLDPPVARHGGVREAIDRGGGQCCDVDGVLRELTKAGYTITPASTPSRDVIAYYSVREGYIFKRPVRTGAGVAMGFPVCLVCDGIDAEQVCAILNRGDPVTE